MSAIRIDDVLLHYVDSGEGTPLVFQHGLGADASQPLEVMPSAEKCRRFVLECRGHGKSGLGPEDRISIPRFADDLSEAIAAARLQKPVVGGISMGAAIALNYACRSPADISGLVLARPAWILDSAPENMRIFGILAELLTQFGAGAATEIRRHEAFHALEQVSPDNAASLLGQIERPDTSTTRALLSHISVSGPEVSSSDLARLAAVPVLVLGNEDDAIHPIEYAEKLAELIPHAQLVKITSKTRSRAAYLAEFRAALDEFLISVGTGGEDDA